FIGDIDLEHVAGGGFDGRFAGVGGVSPGGGLNAADIDRQRASGQRRARRWFGQGGGGGVRARGGGRWSRGGGVGGGSSARQRRTSGEHEATEEELSAGETL